MELTADELLMMLDEAGGKTTEYPFIAMGRESQLEELLKQGLVRRISSNRGFGEIQITDKGRLIVRKRSESA